MDKTIVCQGCNWEWKLSEGGDDPYVCHKCGHDNSNKYINEIKISKEDLLYVNECIESGEVLKEDLARWFKEKWVDVSKKIDGKYPPCGRKSANGEKGRKGYPKCRPLKKVSKDTPKIASSYDKKEKKSMVAQKRREEKKHPKHGKGNTPTFTRYDESINESFDVSPNEYKKILQTKDFLMVVPFTHNASCKYGANTKWCTTKRHDDEDFDEHVSSGLLTYIIIRNPEYRKILDSDKFAIYRYYFSNLSEGLVYTDLNEEHSINWFKKLMENNGLINEYEKIMEIYNEFYIKNGYMGKNTPMNENKTITLNFDTIVETNTYPRLNSNHESKIDISEGLKYHIANNKPILENVYKIGSDNFNTLLEECRDLYMNGDLELSDDDLSFIMENEYGPIENTNYTVGNTPTFTHFNEDNISKITNLVLERLNNTKKIIYEDEFGSVEETDFIPDDLLNEAEYQGRKVKLNKPFLTPNGPKKRSVYVKNEKGNVIKVNFGDPNMRIKKYIPSHRKSFRARHHCETAKDKKTPRYWSCKFW